MKFDKISHPFTPTVRLQAHLKAYPREYAATGNEHLPWPVETIGWQISNDSSPEMGFVWLLPERNNNEAKFFDVAVYDEYSNQKIASKALQFVETQVSAIGVKKLKAIVTSNSAKGIIVRKWLPKVGFLLVSKPSIYAHMPDAFYLLKTPNPVEFEKNYSY